MFLQTFICIGLEFLMTLPFFGFGNTSSNFLTTSAISGLLAKLGAISNIVAVSFAIALIICSLVLE